MKKHNVLVFSLLLSTNIKANNTSKIKSSFESYKQGSYKKVISNLKNLKSKGQASATKHYLLALSYNRLQDYDKSIPHFKRAIKSGTTAQDVYYEFGQALYANNDLGKARSAFKKSFENKFKTNSSLYYVAHISQILEQNKRAKKYYSRIIKSKTADKNLKQVARFQLAEVLLTMARKVSEPERVVKNFVLPQIDKAIKIDNKSRLSGEIRSRKKEIEKEFGLEPNTLRNGRRVAAKRWKLSIAEKVSYDNNISLTNDLPASSASLEDSFIFKTTLNSSYNFILKKRYIISPKFNLASKTHTNKNSQAVRSEDDYNISPSLNNSYEHKLFKNPASLIFNVDYNYKSKYRTELARKSFYSRYVNFTIGEKFKYFTKGDTSFKFKYKDLKSYSISLNSKTKTFAVDQVYLTTKGNILLFLIQYDALDTYNTTSSSTNTTLLRADYINPNFLPKISLHIGGSLNLIDYTDANESLNRGVERTFSPSFKLTKKVTRKLKFSVGYEYTKNTSKKSDYKYSKHVTSTQIKYTF